MACRIPEHVDLAIAGAGPVGATLALLAAQAGRKVALIEARPALAGTTGKDPRVLALSWGSQQILQRVGAWPADLPATPIDSVHVSQHSGLGRVLIQRQDLDLPHLGFTVGYAALNDALAAALAASSVCVLTDTTVTAVTSLGAYARVRCCQAGQAGELTARVLALAEGGALADTLPGMTRREYDYQQRALIARIDTDTPHQGRAFERFAAEGPLALLPNGDSYTLVWTRPHAEAEALLALDDAAFAARLAAVCGERIGQITAVGERAAVPLRLKYATKLVSGRVVLVGNAAQTMHPVAAQGLNLGLRDAAELAQHLAPLGDVGEASRLAAYARARQHDRAAVTGFTHSLVSLFDRHDRLSRCGRAAVMATIDTLAPLRRHFASHLVFGVGVPA